MKRFREDRPSGRLLRPRHLQLPSLRDGRDERVPAAASRPRRSARSTWASTTSGTLARSVSTAGCETKRPARAGRQPLLDLDRLLHPALALQLDAAVLPARTGPRPELGGHGPPDLQPRLHDADFEAVAERFMAACRAMRDDGWWWRAPGSRTRPSTAGSFGRLAARLLRARARRTERHPHDGSPRLRAVRRSGRAARPAAGGGAPCGRAGCRGRDR